ncbi:ATP-binding protein [Streptomyces sparsogenes]|uniref:ATP-binding protein n=1 Tax=Streptomyces sparsogenes TaxID=67365 RepID=UPI0033FDF626
MDPTNRGSEEHGRDTPTPHAAGGGGGTPRSPRDPLTPHLGGTASTPVRTVRLVSGDFLLTVNPVDGSEIEPCPPGERPARPERRGPDERAELRRAAAPPLPAGAVAFEVPMLEREEERERLGRLLARGRSVRVTGPSGAGRSRLLDAVAADCESLAPDGVVRLSGYRRTPTDLLHELYATVYRASFYRPGRAELLEAVAEIGAVVVLDDVEFGGAALDEFLDATPECAFLISATPAVPAPSAGSHLEEVFLSGLSRTGSLELLERAVRRPLEEDERSWAADLWFESEGLPLRFVQAGALLRQRDALRGEERRPAATADTDADPASGSGAASGAGSGSAGAGARDIPLPTLAEGSAPVALIASRLSAAARDALRFAVALGGECPHQTHLPALAGDSHADAALGELIAGGLVTPAGPHYRLAVGVADQLAADGYADETAERAAAAARHYAWWAGHPSVAPERVAVEADAILTAMAALVAEREPGRAEAAVLLARSATPAFAAALHWGAWERALRHGQEAARLAGQVAEEAYFHHELGVLALCTGNLERARAELEASIGLRGVLADKPGTVAGRRALALVTDRSGGPAAPGGPGASGGRTTAGEEVSDARHDESASPPAGGSAGRRDPADTEITVVTPRVATTEPLSRVDVLAAVRSAGAGGAGGAAGSAGAADGSGRTAGAGGAGGARGGRTPLGRRFAALTGARRNMVAAGAGALLLAVLGTVVTLGMTSGDGDEGSAGTVKPGQSSSRQDDDKGLTADEPTSGAGESGQPGPSGVPGAPTSPSTLVSGSPSATESPTAPSSSGEASPTGKPSAPSSSESTTHSPTRTPTSPPTSPSTKPPTQTPTTTPTTPPSTATTSPGGDTTNTASGPATTASGSASTSPTTSASAGSAGSSVSVAT